MKNWISKTDKKYRYQLLDRMRQDCVCYINAHGGVNSLWTETEEEQIEYMLFIWDLFEKDEKPEWLSREQIIEFGRKMGVEMEEQKK